MSMSLRSVIEPLRESTELHTAGLSLPPQATSEAPRSRDATVRERALMTATLLAPAGWSAPQRRPQQADEEQAPAGRHGSQGRVSVQSCVRGPGTKPILR